MHRIPWGKDGPSGSGPRPVVFLQHGLEASSSCWVTNLPHLSMAFMLADAGFDVFMGNSRGNLYSVGHTTLNVSGHEFWKFSWDEMVRYDLDASINKALQLTGQQSLYYVGHSQGTLIMFSKLSAQPEFATKIRKYFALAPVGTVTHIQGLLGYLAHDYYDLVVLMYNLGFDQFLQNEVLVSIIEKLICGDSHEVPLCDSIMFLIGGPDSHQINDTRLPVFLNDEPAGTSMQNMYHWAQTVRAGKQQMFDYGNASLNMQHYGQPTPPEYDLSRITADVHLYWSSTDWLADEQDITEHLLTGIPSNSLKENVHLHDFNHFDFVLGQRAAAEIYQPIIATIQADVKMREQGDQKKKV